MNPYGPILKYGLIALAVIAIVGGYSTWVYRKGEASVQASWDADKASQIIAARKLADTQARATRIVEQNYEDEIAKLRAVPARVVHDRIVTYLHGLCHLPSRSRAVVPSGTHSDLASPTTDAAVRQTDLDSLQADINAAEANTAQLKACQSFVTANGGATP